MFDRGHDSRAIANIFVDKAFEDKKELTITQLVKLVYIAHGWTLGWTGKPLIRDSVEAWRYGPVVPLVYNTFRPQGTVVREKAMDDNGQPYSIKVNESESTIIGNVYKNYSDFSPFKLSDLTHRYDAPWSQHRDHHFHVINNDDIEIYYRKLVEVVKKGDYDE